MFYGPLELVLWSREHVLLTMEYVLGTIEHVLWAVKDVIWLVDRASRARGSEGGSPEGAGGFGKPQLSSDQLI